MNHQEPASGMKRICRLGIALAAVAGGLLLADAIGHGSATYDEVAYLRIASEWWRAGKQDRITRMGSPLTFWKLQQGPVLWLLDRSGQGRLIEAPERNQAILLPAVRLGSIWIWLAALLLTSGWAWDDHGPLAGLLAAWLFALSPNLLAHGSLVTMEMPLIACCAAMCWLFTRFLDRGGRRPFWACAVVAGLAFSCKFSVVVVPPLLGLAWWLQSRRQRGRRVVRDTWRIALMMAGFLMLMMAADFAVTGGALVPLSERRGDHPILSSDGAMWRDALGRWLLETPIPQDWAGFARQLHHQRSGGPSYLFGERRMTGWWHYYLVCLAVKMPLGIGLLCVLRAALWRKLPATAGDRLALTLVLGTLLIVALGSSRNYGFRYILFLAPAAIVWISGLVRVGRWGLLVACLGVLGQAIALTSIHPFELSYFNALAGGPEGGRRILADSNLDWGQGLRSLARLQQEDPRYRDLTTYYFGDTHPSYYGVAGPAYVIDAHGPVEPLPTPSRAETAYLAVSRSLQYGPWGPPAFFRSLDAATPVVILPDHTMAIYRTADLRP
jgi:hypothetical protein